MVYRDRASSWAASGDEHAELQIRRQQGVCGAHPDTANNGILVKIISAASRLTDASVEPLDRPAGSPGGLPDLALRARVPDTVRAHGRVRTHLDPNDLADEAFLRRIPNKILVDAVDNDIFERIFHG